jgi:hypothetical protein
MLKGLGAKTNWSALNRQSWSNSDPDSEAGVQALLEAVDSNPAERIRPCD